MLNTRWAIELEVERANSEVLESIDRESFSLQCSLAVLAKEDCSDRRVVKNFVKSRTLCLEADSMVREIPSIWNNNMMRIVVRPSSRQKCRALIAVLRA